MVPASMDATSAAPAAVENDLRRLRETTGEVVGSVFYGTLLKTMRDSVLKGEYGHGGRGEDVFGAQLDAMIASRIGKTSHRGSISDTLYRRLEAPQQRASEARMRAERAKG